MLPRGGARLVVLSGRDRGRILALPPEGSAILGRGESCDLRLSDPTLSSRHCRFETDGEGIRLVDLGSSNGTRVNGQLVADHRLEDGDVLLVGGVRLDYLTSSSAENREDISAILHQLMASRNPSGSAFPSTRDCQPRRPGRLTDHDALELLFQTGRIANGQEGAAPVIQGCLDAVLRSVQARRVLYQSTAHEDRILAVSPPTASPMPPPIPPQAANQVRAGETVVLRVPSSAEARHGDPRSLVCVPVQTGDEIFGTLFAEVCGNPDAFDGHTAEVLTAVADILASALHREQMTQERREIEVRLQERENLALLGLLSSGIAHDLGNVLSCLVSYAELAGLRPEKLPALPDYVQRVCRKGMDTIQTLLSTARRPQEESRIFDVREVVRDVASLVTSDMTSRGIRVVQDLPVEPCHLRGNPGDVQDLLLNLCLNAGEAMSGGGTLRIACRFEPPRMIVEVSDQGVGIPPDRLPGLFTPFRSVRTGGPRRGTGLGLYRVKSIVDAHSGAIEVRSTVGEGTTFRIAFPTGITETP